MYIVPPVGLTWGLSPCTSLLSVFGGPSFFVLNPNKGPKDHNIEHLGFLY